VRNLLKINRSLHEANMKGGFIELLDWVLAVSCSYIEVVASKLGILTSNATTPTPNPSQPSERSRFLPLSSHSLRAQRKRKRTRTTEPSDPRATASDMR
jgi:hypothetical protein